TESASQVSTAKVTSRREAVDDRGVVPQPTEPESREPTRYRVRMVPVLITLSAVVLAALLGWAMWDVYMGGPWTRDATVRDYIGRMAPEVAGRIVELPVVDNQYVRRGDLLMVIDPINYRIAVSLGEATERQAQASVRSIDAQIAVQRAQVDASRAQVG